MGEGEEKIHGGKGNKAKEGKRREKGTDLGEDRMGGEKTKREEKKKSIRESKYNKCKKIVEKGIPVYLREGRKEENGEK